MNDEPVVEDPDDDDDEVEAEINPSTLCRHCWQSECHGDCYYVLGLNTP